MVMPGASAERRGDGQSSCTGYDGPRDLLPLSGRWLVVASLSATCLRPAAQRVAAGKAESLIALGVGSPAPGAPTELLASAVECRSGAQLALQPSAQGAASTWF